jgi:hypothetical protein
MHLVLKSVITPSEISRFICFGESEWQRYCTVRHQGEDMTLSRLPYNFEEALAEVKMWRSSHIPAGDIRALKHRIHELEGELIGYKKIIADLEAEREPVQPVQEPVSMRMPKLGDKVICIEDYGLGKVVSVTAGGSPDIKFDDGSHGTYLLREFAELFGYVNATAAQPPPEWEAINNILNEYGLQAISFVAEWKAAMAEGKNK